MNQFIEKILGPKPGHSFSFTPESKGHCGCSVCQAAELWKEQAERLRTLFEPCNELAEVQCDIEKLAGELRHVERDKALAILDKLAVARVGVNALLFVSCGLEVS